MSSNSKLYATCPLCGRRLCKAIPGSEIEIECGKCQNSVLISVDKDGKVTTQVVEEQQQKKVQ